MQKKGRVTMEDVAKAANVSTQTVSRVFQDSPQVKPKTKEKVLQVAEQLNFIKNNTASALRCGSSKIVVIVYNNLTNVYFAIMADLLRYKLYREGYLVQMFASPNDGLDIDLYKSIVSFNAEAIISFFEVSQQVADFVKIAHVPVLCYGRSIGFDNISCIATDDFAGGALAAQHLVGYGGKKFLCVMSSAIKCGIDRMMGFQMVLEENHLSPAEIIDTSFNQSDEKLHEILNTSSNNYDGIFCFNDMFALRLLRLFEEKNVKPPRIIGFDDIQEEFVCPQRLTTIGYNKEEMAEQAVRIVLKLINNHKYNEKIIIKDLYLVVGTTA